MSDVPEHKNQWNALLCYGMLTTKCGIIQTLTDVTAEVDVLIQVMCVCCRTTI